MFGGIGDRFDLILPPAGIANTLEDYLIAYGINMNIIKLNE